MDFNVAKIVGTASQNSWSQVHVFKPNADEPGGREKLDSHGYLLAALEFKAIGEGVDVTSFGAEIIRRLQEIYFANESQGILKKVNQTMETLAAEFLPQIELNLVMVIAWKEFIYVGRSNGGQVYLKRGETLVPLFAEETETAQVVSGKLEAHDKVILGSKRFFKIIPEGTITSAMNQGSVDEALETLAAIVHGHEANSRAAGIVFEVSGESKPEAVTETQSEEVIGAKEVLPATGRVSFLDKLQPVFEGAGAVFQSVTRPVTDLLSRRQLTFGSADNKKRRMVVTIAIILLLVFGASLVLAARKRGQSQNQQEIAAITEEVNFRVSEAKGLLESNPLRAKSLLNEGKVRLEEYKTAHDNKLPESLTALEQELLTLLGAAQRDFSKDGVEWFAFNLTEDGFIGSDWEADENTVSVWDQVKQSLLTLNLTNKSSDVLVSGSEVAGGKLVGLAGDRSYVMTGDKVAIVDEDGDVVDEVAAEDWGNITDAVGFGGNLYLLDSVASGQIWKYTGVDAGLGSKTAYLKGEDLDLSSAASMAIDGSVWVLFSDGTIVKYVRGVKDSFVVTGLDEALVEPVKIYTSPEVENLYILDRQTTRVVVIGKNGEYQAQYRWLGIAGAKDLVVSEELKKILLLTGEKVFSLDLQ